MSPVFDSGSYPLPIDINELQLLLKSEDYHSDSLFKRTKNSKPYGRKDAVNLANWLEEMHKKYLKCLDTLIEAKDIVEIELADTVEAIYIIALKESIKQIAVYCEERAVMLHRIFEILRYTWRKSPDDLHRKIESMKTKHQQDMAKYKKVCGIKAEQLESRCKDLESRLEESNKEKDLLRNETHILKKYMNQMRQDVENKKNDPRLSKYLKKQTIEFGMQTEVEDEVSSESSSSEEISGGVNVGEQTSLTRILTRQQTMPSVPDKRIDHLTHLKKHIDLANCSGQLVIDDLYQYITSEYNDFYAWVDGFRLASEIMPKARPEEPLTGATLKETVMSDMSEAPALPEFTEEKNRKVQRDSTRFLFRLKPT